MNYDHQTLLFFGSLALTLSIVVAAMTYLRAATHNVLMVLCDDEFGAKFWLRCADVLAIAGSLILVILLTANAKPEAHWTSTLRSALGASLLGVFISVSVVSSSIWSRIGRAQSTAEGSPVVREAT